VIGRVLNAGSGVETSIAEVLRMIGEIVGVQPQISEDQARLRPNESEVMRLVCDATLLRDATGWAPRISLREGLEATCSWFREPSNLARYKWDRFNV